MYAYQHETAERTEMRHWLRHHGVEPVVGNEPNHTELLMKQTHRAGGDPHALMKAGRAKVDERKAQA